MYPSISLISYYPVYINIDQSWPRLWQYLKIYLTMWTDFLHMMSGSYFSHHYFCYPITKDTDLVSDKDCLISGYNPDYQNLCYFHRIWCLDLNYFVSRFIILIKPKLINFTENEFLKLNLYNQTSCIYLCISLLKTL